MTGLLECFEYQHLYQGSCLETYIYQTKAQQFSTLPFPKDRYLRCSYYFFPPTLIVPIPFNRLFKICVEVVCRRPSKIALHFRPVNGIPPVVAWSIFNKLNERFVFSHDVQDFFYNRKIVDVIRQTTDTVRFADGPLLNDHIDRATVIGDIEPITNIQTVTVHWHFFILHGVNNCQGNEFFREHERAVIVRTI